MRPLLRHITDEHVRRLAESVFDQFDDLVVPAALPTLPRQVVHGDFSPYNLIVDSDAQGYVTGVIDFGDVVHTCRVFDVAVRMANLLCDIPEDPWGRAEQFAEGYLDLRSLTGQELGLLRICAQARVLLRILMARWRAVEDPTRSSYLISHSVKDWTHLRLAHSVAAGAVKNRLRAIVARREKENRRGEG